MAANKDGGPAFPHVRRAFGPGGIEERITDGGMSLRDWFAGQALLGLLSRQTYIRTTRVQMPSVVRQAWELADAMLAERERRSKAEG